MAALYRQDDLYHMTCRVYEGQKIILYCCQCDQAVCFKCYRELHSDHGQLDMQEIYEDNISKMKNLQDKITTDLQFFKSECMKLKKLLPNHKKESDVTT